MSALAPRPLSPASLPSDMGLWTLAMQVETFR